jgi:TorA maturation chaperone TorD
MPEVELSAPVAFRPTLSPEDVARADFYALLGRLFASAPDRALLASIARAPALGVATLADSDASAGPGLSDTWDALRAASSVMEPEAAEQEYVDLFVGVGKSEVNLHASHWMAGFMNEKPLVEVRADLAALGLSRRPDSVWVEDHLSSLCEAMRALITGVDGGSPATLARQRAFFERHLMTWVNACCGAITQAPIANYYRRVAEFTQSFMAIERDSFAME